MFLVLNNHERDGVVGVIWGKRKSEFMTIPPSEGVCQYQRLVLIFFKANFYLTDVQGGGRPGGIKY